MKKIKKLSVTVVLGLIIFTSLAPIVHASQGYWSGTLNFTVNAGPLFGNPSAITNRKRTISTLWDLHAYSRSMASRPVVRLSTSNGISRSRTLSTPNNNTTEVGTGNTASFGEYVHVQVRAAANQVTNGQTLRFRFRAR